MLQHTVVRSGGGRLGTDEKIHSHVHVESTNSTDESKRSDTNLFLEFTYYSGRTLII